MPETTTVEDELTIFRAEMFAELGFKEDDAFNLAEARAEDGFHLYWGRVRNMLEQGATHDQILRIFT
jgi:hypothetical protein